MRKLSLPGVAAAAAALVMASCDSDVNGPQSNDNVTVITASISEAAPASRTAIDPTAYEGGHVGLLWSPGDAIGVYDGATVRNARFDNQSQTASGRTTFAGNCSNPQYAYYPYSADNDASEVTAVKGSLAAVQSYDAATRVISGDYKYGTPRTGAPSEFDFKHIFSLLRFNVNATGTDIAGETLKSVSITLPESRVLAGDFTFNILNGAYTFTANTSNKVTVEYAGSPVLTDGATHTAYLSCAPDLHEGDAITVEVLTDKKRASFTAEVAYDFKANAIYTFDLNLSAYADRLTIETLPTEPEEETANCYMITTTGEYDFKATVIGNGEKGIIKGAGFHTENPYISPVEAKLLWEDVQGFITGVTLRDGRVHYTANANVGNALIAVYDAQGTILWSWHIWGVGDTLPGEYEISTKAGSTFQIMDRNLGAFPATDAQRMETTRTAENEAYVLHCMLYQWGRKDPFPNSDKYYVNGSEVNIANEYPVFVPASADEATIEAGVRHPEMMVGKYTGSTGDSWLAEDKDLLWGDDRFSGQNDGDWTNVKTIYDPSPVGYRVPNYYTFTGFIVPNRTDYSLKGVISYSTNATTGEIIPELSKDINCVIDTVGTGASARWLPLGIHKERIGFAYGSSSNSDKIFGYGLYMKRFPNDTEGNYYPMSGYRLANSNGKRDGYAKNANYWLSCGAVTNTVGKGTLYLGRFFWRTSSYSSGADAGLPSGSSGVNGSIKTQDFRYPLYGNAVRCVREK